MSWAIGVSVLSQIILSQILLCTVLGLGATIACDVIALAIVSIWFVLTDYLAGSDIPTDAEVRLFSRSRESGVLGATEQKTGLRTENSGLARLPGPAGLQKILQKDRLLRVTFAKRGGREDAEVRISPQNS